MTTGGSPGRIRVHAVSTNRPMLRALEATLRDAELTTSTTLADVPSGIAEGTTVVLDADTTARGLEDVAVLRATGLDGRIVVIGDEVPALAPDGDTSLLVRPVPFAELIAMLDPLVTPVVEPDRVEPERVEPERDEPATQVALPWRGRARGRDRPTRPTDELEDRIARGVPVLEDLLFALREFPELRDLDLLAEDLIEEVLGAVPRATTAALLLHVDPIYLQAVAARGVSPAERLLRVPLRHPLVTYVRDHRTGVLLHRQDAAGLVHGLPGVRAPALLAHSLRTDRRWHGFIVLGGAHLDDADLGRMSDVVDAGGTAVVLAFYVRQLAAPTGTLGLDGASPRAG